jgi:carboxypeptidase Taq
MTDKLSKLKTILAKKNDLELASAALEWDRETYMPPGGSESRGNVMATLDRLAHELFTSDEIGKLLEELSGKAKDWEADSNDARLIKVTQREYERATKMPSKMVAEKAVLLNTANVAWREAKEKSEFPIYEPHLEKVIDFMRRTADLYKPYAHPYDPLLAEFEPGIKTADVQIIFDEIRPKQVELIEAISKQPQVDDSVLYKHYPTVGQIQAGAEIVAKFGFDFNRGRQDAVHHPFASNLGYGDQRITYEVDENFFNPYLYGILHESGHGMYEQGIPKELSRTPLYDGASLTIHESQSRLWENQIGRSRAFWQYYFPRLKEIFPSQFENVNVETFYKASNIVKPSFIRIEADEATYNLHIMLRMEIEIGLTEGTFAVKDLPEIWNSRMESYLGITPANDAEGVLQDVHWSFGAFGYFSTYALGNLVSAQVWNAMKEENPDVDDQIRDGDFSKLFTWLNDKIYRHGNKFEPQELVQMVTGEKINGDAYINYLNEKFSDIYEL